MRVYCSLSACESCEEGEVCSVVNEENGARYPICKGPNTGILYFFCIFIIIAERIPLFMYLKKD